MVYITDTYRFLSPLTAAYVARVVADGGEVIDTDWVESIYNTWNTQGISSGIICAYSSNAGIKKDGSDRVSKFYDLSLNEEDLEQLTGSNQTLFEDGLNGRKKLYFDGVNDIFPKRVLTASYSQVTTHYTVMEPTVVPFAKNERIYPTGTTNPRQIAQIYSSIAKIKMYAGTWSVGSNVMTQQPYIIKMKFNGASSKFRFNGGTDGANQAAGNNAFEDIAIGTASEAPDMDFYEGMSYDGHLNDTKSNAIRDMFNAYYTVY